MGRESGASNSSRWATCHSLHKIEARQSHVRILPVSKARSAGATNRFQREPARMSWLNIFHTHFPPHPKRPQTSSHDLLPSHNPFAQVQAAEIAQSEVQTRFEPKLAKRSWLNDNKRARCECDFSPRTISQVLAQLCAGI